MARRRTIEDVPDKVDLETDGEVWASLDLDWRMRWEILEDARRWHQSIQVAIERWVNAALRRGIARAKAEAQP